MSAAVNERAFSEVKRLCCAGLEGHELLHAVTGRLRRAVPFEAYCASTMDPASGLITHALAAETFGEKEAAIFFDHLYFEHDMSPFERMTQDRRPVELLSESTGGKPYEAGEPSSNASSSTICIPRCSGERYAKRPRLIASVSAAALRPAGKGHRAGRRPPAG